MGKIEYDKRKGQELWLYCNLCQKETSHINLMGIDSEEQNEIEWNNVVTWWQNCDVVQCGGCKNVTFTKISTDSETYTPGDENDIRQFPPKEDKAQWYIKDDIHNMPDLLRQIYMQTVQAISTKCYTLAGIGLRAIVETLCKDKNIKGSNLEKRIDNLVTDGFLTTSGAEILHGIRLIGNDAAHDTKAPRVEQINAAMKVIDHLILGIYVIPEEASKALPKRTKKTSSKTTAPPKLGATSAKK